MVAGLLLCSGALHLPIWLVDGSAWEGATSFRKPILFGFSAGVTVLSMGWLAGKLPRWTGDSVLLSLFAVAMLLEVSLITMQTWRDVASHFNRSTLFDAWVLGWIEALIVFATAVIVLLALRSLGPLYASRDMQLAIRGGMALLVFACVFGFWMVSYGNERLASGAAPEVYGQRGVMKFPHGMPIHAIQYLPVLSWWLRQRGVLEAARWEQCCHPAGVHHAVYTL